MRPGTYEVFVVVDHDDAVKETDETNNARSTTVRFASLRLQIPLVFYPLNLP